ncbi:PQQ-dependent sugar dehydrogenase [Flaviaesturariibacter aridisoli]|uniref:PQQ-dependent sugar dehydrogenase n=1 Tax=Flaviaesturariibacter aridisoli TaxID=2545761 RepID=A0A4R4E1X0_9BACT|nr:PQQ-dependent sugar dehydrogenase [Flaviaesturariibacter aridisoli]TCZ73379.1 PQQ-dependent sugar dehydrogenase [Flaviaesturariibacter aridisoli]
MNHTILILCAGITAVAGAQCGNSAMHSGSTPTNDSTPVETRKPNSDYRPAFAGQTRAPGVHSKTPWEAKVLTRALSRPWGLTVLPDGRLLITEKGGTMRIAGTDGTLSAPITGLPAVNDAGQGGLLDVAIDPAFAQTRFVYWTFSEALPEGNLTAVGKGKLSADERRMEGATVIYRARPAYDGTLHYGGRLVVDSAGYLFVSTGERSDLATRPQAQWLNSALGKVLRITRDGQPAPGNPFFNQKDAFPELYSYGHRNIQGLALHPETGALWESEMGPRGGDEVNRIEAGKNYGWPAITYGIEYNGSKVGPGATQAPGMEQPVYYWDPVLSPSGITFYSGAALPEWKNNLFLCGLNSQHIARLVIVNDRVVGEERLLEGEKHRWRAITEGRDGALYAVTDGSPGLLYRIAKR